MKVRSTPCFCSVIGDADSVRYISQALTMEGEFEDEPRIGGYNFAFVDELSPGQSCSICLLAMRSPVQTVCGHRFCKGCLLKAFSEGEVPVCPQDRSRIPENEGFFRDVAWEREILSLRVKCKKNERGCNWTGQLRHYEEHFVACQYEEVTRDDCKGEMQRRLLHEHTTSECPNRIVQCVYCEEEFPIWFTKFHEDNECARFPLECTQECGFQIPREEVESHVRDDCLMTMVHCPYEEAGCTFHDQRSNLNDHLETSNEEHLRKTWSKLLRTTERLKELEAVEGQIEELQTDKESMKMLLDGNSEEISDLKLSAKKLEVENMALKKDVAALQKQLEEVKLTAAGDKEEVRSLKAEFNALKKDVEELRCSTPEKSEKKMNNYWACHPQSVRLKPNYSVLHTETAIEGQKASGSMESQRQWTFAQNDRLEGKKKEIKGMRAAERIPGIRRSSTKQ